MRALILIAPLILTACAGSNHLDYLRMRDIPTPNVQSFTHCYNYGCAKRQTVAMPSATKAKITSIFSKSAQTSKTEQDKIITSLQILEQDIGKITGTENDKHGTFRIYQDNSPNTKSFQQDCIDESTNTTIYITLLNDMGFLKYHRPDFPANRHPLISGNRWWHQSATIQNIETGERYAVDTWFEDNGEAGYILPLEQWKKGWNPENSKNNEQLQSKH